MHIRLHRNCKGWTCKQEGCGQNSFAETSKGY